MRLAELAGFMGCALEWTMHLFSTDELLHALADAWFPGQEREIANYRTGGRTFRLLRVGRSPITKLPFVDFFDSIDAAPHDGVRQVRYLPCAVLRTHTCGASPPAAEPGAQPAPFLSWKRFETWRDFEKHFCSRRSSLLRDSRAKRRHLEQDLGPLRYEWDDRRPEVFARCLEWKSAQYLRSGLADLFARRENVRLFQILQERRLLVISSLTAGETLLAVHFGAITGEGRFYSWVAAYDPAHGRYSPGRLLLEAMLKDSFTRGHEEWDFGIGSMEYKWHYATDYRVIGALGTPPLGLVLSRAARTVARRTLGLYPPMLAQARRVRRYLRQLPARRRQPELVPEPVALVEQAPEQAAERTSAAHTGVA